jgi:ubiquitin-protein ligase
MTALFADIEKWNSKKDIKIMNISLTGNIINFTIDNLKIKLHQPTNADDFYVIESSYPWINELNVYSMMNKPNFLKLMLKLIKLYETSQTESKNDFIDMNTVLLNDTEYEIYKMKHFLEECWKTSSNPLSIASTKTIQLFDNKMVGNIIIEEFMTLYKKIIQTNKIEVSLNDNNIYNWKVIYKNFNNHELNQSLIKLNEKYGYNGITMNIKFHSTLYPNFPPTISIIRPKLANSLMHKIANMHMILLDYWTPTRSVEYIVNKIYDVLNKHAIVLDSDMNDIHKYQTGSFLQIEQYLMQLASFVDSTKDELDDVLYIKISDLSKSNMQKMKHPNKDVHWKSGTGYGHNNAPTWDINAYIKSQEEKDNQIHNILEKILNELYNITKENAHMIYETINNSYLISYIKNQLTGITMLEMNKHINIYKTIFIILQNFANEDAIFLFDKRCNQSDQQNDKHSDQQNDQDHTTDISLFEIFQSLYHTVESIKKISKDDSDELSNIIISVYEMINSIYIKKTDTNKMNNIKQIDVISEENLYYKTLEPLKFDEAQIVNTNYYYQKKFDTEKGHPVKYAKRIVQEYTTLMQSLPIHYKASIFARIDPVNMCAMRFLMTGPENTPYECGCFIFDMYVTTNFPQGPPEVYYLNTGGKRFNPNLYADGKVCLSILGTWQGSESEKWNEKTSSFFQILMSIQSQILIEEPYFNEPGYESNASEKAKKASYEYNQNIRLYTMKYAILDLIKNPSKYNQFIDVIKEHFKIRKNRVLEVCKGWTDDASSLLKPDYEKTYEEIVSQIENI